MVIVRAGICALVLAGGCTRGGALAEERDATATATAAADASADGPALVADAAPDLTSPDVSPAHLTIDKTEALFASAGVGCGGALVAFRVTNTGGGDSGTLAVEVPDDFVATADGCSRSWLAPAQSCDLALEFVPTAAGVRDGILAVKAQPGGPAQALLQATGSSEGAGRPFVSPARLGFMRPAGGPWFSSPQQVTVSNPGLSPLPILKVALSGRHPDNYRIGADGCTGTLLAPAATCAIDVEFRATAPVLFFALLNVTAGPGGPCGGGAAVVPLFGVGDKI